MDAPTPSMPAGGLVQDLHLADYLRVLLRQWKLVVAAVVVLLATMLVKAWVTVPLYRASTVVLVEREKISVSDLGVGSGRESMDAWYWSRPEFMATQMRLITAQDLLEKVVRRLDAAGVGKAAPRADAASVEAAEAARIETRVKEIQGGLQVQPVKGTSLLELAFVSTDPKEAARVVSAVAEAYIEWNRQATIDTVGQASRFLEAQIEQLKNEIEEKERALQAYGRQKDIISMDPGTNVTLQKLQKLNEDYAAAVADRVAKESRVVQLQAMSPESIADLDAGMAAARREQQKLEQEYSEKLSIYKPDLPSMEQLKGRIQQGKQYLAGLAREVATKTRDGAKADLEAAQRRETSLQAVLRGQTSETMALNANAIEYNNLKVEATTKRALLDAMLKRQSETEVAARLSGVRQGNIRVIERAQVPSYRFAPSYRQAAQRGILWGLTLGVALAFGAEYLDRSVRTTEQVEEQLKLPALGVIPAVGGGAKGYGYGSGYGYGYGLRRRRKKPGAKAEAESATAGSEESSFIEMLPERSPRGVVTEAYRAFRTALLLSRAGGLKSLVISSALPGEGKTSTAMNLSIVLAQLGRKVLLVDADLHKPRVHEVLKLSNRIGLVSILAESRDPLAGVQTTSVAGLSVVTAGPISPNPSGLLMSGAMDAFLEAVTAGFDYVVFDSPPVHAVADALILGAKTDGVVLCVRGGKTPREVVAKAKNRLLQANVKVLGVVINNLRQTLPRFGGSYSYQDYDYGYGQAYGTTPEKPA